ncbi:D-alanyl-D-alanine carboxypeptidase/D-alanyl-D-alanine-endopeptidase [soil metagenome]
MRAEVRYVKRSCDAIARRTGLLLLAAALAAGCARTPQRGVMEAVAATPVVSAPVAAAAEAPGGPPKPAAFRDRGTEHLTELGNAIGAIFDRPDFTGARWGVVVRSFDTGETVYHRNETQTFAPASNEKLFTTTTALLLLGPDYKYATKFYTTGNLAGGGVLDGSLIVQGNGNFCIGPARPGEATAEQIAALARQCKAAGIQQINGDIIGDDTWIDPQLKDWRSGSQVLNENRITATLTDGGAPLLDPEGAPAKIINQVQHTDQAADPAPADRRGGARLHAARADSPDFSADQSVFYLTGQTHAGETITASGSFSGDRAVELYLDVLKSALEREGVKVSGGTRVLKAKDAEYAALMSGATMKFQSLSPPLSEILAWTNKPSDNYLAERLFLTDGFNLAGVASPENGAKAVKQELAKFGIQPDNYKLVDGSGLSHSDAVRPADIVTLLDAMRETEHFPTFYASLPIAGVDGTLRNRMKDTPAEGNVHAKTGHIRGVTALSGYATSHDGERFTFSMIINENQGASAVPDGAENEVAALIAGFGR